MEFPAFGIDLGATCSSIALFKNEEPNVISFNSSAKSVASIVIYWGKNITIGQNNYKRIKYSKSAIYDTKEMLGQKYSTIKDMSEARSWPFDIENDESEDEILINIAEIHKKLHPYEVTSEIFKYLINAGNDYLPSEKRTRKVVLSAPGYFNEKQLEYLKKAAIKADLEVLKIISEPVAVCIAYGYEKYHNDKRKLIVFDIGGKKITVSLVEFNEGKYELISVECEEDIGGDYFDEETYKFLISINHLENYDKECNLKYKYKILDRINETKIELTNRNESELSVDLKGDTYLEYNLTLETFENINKTLIERITSPIERLLKKNELNVDNIDDFFLSGGSCKMKFVSRILSEYFHKNPYSNPKQDDDYPYSVVKGSCIVAHEIWKGSPVQEFNFVPNNTQIKDDEIEIQFEIKLRSSTDIHPFKKSFPKSTLIKDIIQYLVDEIKITNFIIKYMKKEVSKEKRIDEIFTLKDSDSNILFITNKQIKSFRPNITPIPEEKKISNPTKKEIALSEDDSSLHTPKISPIKTDKVEHPKEKDDKTKEPEKCEVEVEKDDEIHETVNPSKAKHFSAKKYKPKTTAVKSSQRPKSKSSHEHKSEPEDDEDTEKDYETKYSKEKLEDEDEDEKEKEELEDEDEDEDKEKSEDDKTYEDDDEKEKEVEEKDKLEDDKEKEDKDKEKSEDDDDDEKEDIKSKDWIRSDDGKFDADDEKEDIKSEDKVKCEVEVEKDDEMHETVNPSKAKHFSAKKYKPKTTAVKSSQRPKSKSSHEHKSEPEDDEDTEKDYETKYSKEKLEDEDEKEKEKEELEDEIEKEDEDKEKSEDDKTYEDDDKKEKSEDDKEKEKLKDDDEKEDKEKEKSEDDDEKEKSKDDDEKGKSEDDKTSEDDEEKEDEKSETGDSEKCETKVEKGGDDVISSYPKPKPKKKPIRINKFKPKLTKVTDSQPPNSEPSFKYKLKPGPKEETEEETKFIKEKEKSEEDKEKSKDDDKTSEDDEDKEKSDDVEKSKVDDEKEKSEDDEKPKVDDKKEKSKDDDKKSKDGEDKEKSKIDDKKSGDDEKPKVDDKKSGDDEKPKVDDKKEKSKVDDKKEKSKVDDKKEKSKDDDKKSKDGEDKEKSKIDDKKEKSKIDDKKEKSKVDDEKSKDGEDKEKSKVDDKKSKDGEDKEKSKVDDKKEKSKVDDKKSKVDDKKEKSKVDDEKYEACKTKKEEVISGIDEKAPDVKGKDDKPIDLKPTNPKEKEKAAMDKNGKKAFKLKKGKKDECTIC